MHAQIVQVETSFDESIHICNTFEMGNIINTIK